MDATALLLLFLNKQEKSFVETVLLVMLVGMLGLIVNSEQVQIYFSDLISKIFKKKVESEYIITYNEYKCPILDNHDVRSTPSEPLPYELQAVMRMIGKLKPNMKGAMNINKGKQSVENYKVDYIIMEPIGVELINGIMLKTERIDRGQLQTKAKKGNSSREYIHIEHRLILYSHKLKQCELMRELDRWIAEYINEIDRSDSGLLFCEYKRKMRDLEPHEIGYITSDKLKLFNNNWNVTDFKTNKTFDKLFFPEKELLLKRLRRFTNGRDSYEGVGIPYMFGLLLSGIPGSGKTSTIKAIAVELNMHIVSIPLNKIKTGSELVDIFVNPYINNNKIPIEKRIYVFEDIDCMSNVVIARDTTKDRKDKEDKKNGMHELEKQTIVINNMNNDSDEEEKSDTDKLTLHTMLNILDGLMEQSGRVIIMTTNYPEKLDSALVRPGRMDMRINFSYATTETIHDMFNFYYRGFGYVQEKKNGKQFDILLKEVKNTDLLNGKFSTAEIISNILLMLDDPRSCYKILLEKANKDLDLDLNKGLDKSDREPKYHMDQK
jgi:AAA+ superfamily predicted ATPase